MTITNPLLLQNPIKKIDQINASHVEEAISQVIKDNLDQIEKIVKLNWR